MKKYSKLIAVLLAIAVVICPMISVVASADGAPSGTYKLEQVDGDTVKLTINSTDGFLVYKAVINCTTSLSNFAVVDYTLKSGNKEPGYTNPAISHSTSGDNTTILVSSTDAGTLAMYTQVVITMDVTAGANVKLTNIQAADEGDVNTDATLLDFPGVSVAANGDINPDAPDYPAADAEVKNVHTHVATTTVAAAAATCSAAGTQGYVYCETCNKYFTDNTFATETTVEAREIAIDPTAHNYGEYNSDGNATCTEDGTKTRVCAYDSEHKDTVTDTGSKLGHSYTTRASGEKATDANCESPATYYVQCDRCDEVDRTKTVAVGAANGHSFTTKASSTVKTPASCTAAAVYYVQCDNCTTVSDTVTVSVGDPLEHNYVWDGVEGNGQHTVVCQNGCEDSKLEDCDTKNDGACSVCGYKAAPAHVHDYTDHFEVITQPTKDATGTKRCYCECDEYEDQTIAMPTVLPTKTYKTTDALIISDKVGIQFTIGKKNILTSTTEGFDSYFLRIDYQDYAEYNYTNKSLDIGMDEYISKNTNDTQRYYLFNELPIYGMTLNYTVTIYAVKGGVVTGYYTYEPSSIVDAANATATKNLSNIPGLTAYADAIQFGSELQAYFAHQSYNAGKDITEAELPNTLYNYNNYATALNDISLPYKDLKGGQAVTANGFQAASPNVAIAASNEVELKVKLPSPATYLPENFTVRVHYTNGYGDEVSKTFAVANMEYDPTSNASRNYYYVTFKNLALYDLEKTIYFDLNYNGVTQYTYSYKLGTYVNANQASSANGMDLVVKSMGALYESCKAACFVASPYIED